jgi:O-antigen/teichoic acid export membrane protein
VARYHPGEGPLIGQDGLAADAFARRRPLKAVLGRLLDGELLRSSTIVFAGNAVARLLAFLFYIVAARLLGPADYGTLAYALAILATAAVLLANSPGGLSRFLARHMDNRPGQEVYYANWLAVIGLMFVVSVVVFVPIAPLVGLGGLLTVGVVLNLANIAVFETYVQAQRGLSRFAVISIYYTLSNLLQLLAILAAAALGLRSAPLFLILYGLSAIVALGAMRLVAPTPLTPRPAALAWGHMKAIGRYIAPVIGKGVFDALWYSADLILIQRLLEPAATGNYAAAKTLAQALILAPIAISLAVSPRVARLPESSLRAYLPRVLGLAAAVIAPLAVTMAVLRHPLTQLFYGARYTHVTDAFVPLLIGASLYGLYLVLVSVWGALGRRGVGMVATGCGSVTTVGLGLLLIPAEGYLGAGTAFAAGAAAQVLVIGAYTVWGLYLGPTVRIGHLPDEVMLGRFASAPGLTLAPASMIAQLAPEEPDRSLRLVGDMGSGSLGRTWVVEGADGRRMAAKRMVPNRPDGRTAAELRPVATTLTGLRDPNLVPVAEVHQVEDALWVLSELDSGVTLARLTSASALGPRPIAAVVKAVFDGLEALHREGAGHMSLHANNVHVGIRGNVRLGDGALRQLLEGTEDADPDHESRELAGLLRQVADRRLPGPEWDAGEARALASALEALRPDGPDPVVELATVRRAAGTLLSGGGREESAAELASMVATLRPRQPVSDGEPVPSAPAVAGRRSRRRALVAGAGAAILLIALAGGAVAWISSGGAAPVATQRPAWPSPLSAGPAVATGPTAPGEAGTPTLGLPAPAFGPARDGVVTSVELADPAQGCVPGAACQVRVTVRLAPTTNAKSVAWSFKIVDRCTGVVVTEPGLALTAQPAWPYVYGTSTLSLPAGRSLAIVAVTSSPAPAASAPLRVPHAGAC